MTEIDSYSKRATRGHAGSAPARRPLGFGSPSALGALVAAALVLGCAGELDTDLTSFKNAFADSSGTGGTTSGGSGTAGGSSGTTGGTGTGTGGTANLPLDPDCLPALISSKCGPCHTDQFASLLGANLTLQGTGLGARLSTTKATYLMVPEAEKAKCVPDALIIDPVTPENSILLKKVSGNPACGGAMPSAPGLSGDDLACIRDWVLKF